MRHWIQRGRYDFPDPIGVVRRYAVDQRAVRRVGQRPCTRLGQGLPFREAHRVVGALVRDCLASGRRLPDLSLAELRRFSDAFGPDAVGITAERAVAAIDLSGGRSYLEPDWGLRSTQDDPNSDSWDGNNVFDVYTKSQGIAIDGTKYRDW